MEKEGTGNCACNNNVFTCKVDDEENGQSLIAQGNCSFLSADDLFDQDFEEKELKFYYLDLLAFRSISNMVAEKFGIIHQFIVTSVNLSLI